MTWTQQRMKNVAILLNIVLFVVPLIFLVPGEIKIYYLIVCLIVDLVAAGMALQYLSWCAQSNMYIYQTGRMIMKADGWVKQVPLPKIKDSKRSNVFNMYEGGMHRYSFLRSKPSIVIFENEDCRSQVYRGKTVNIIGNGQPVWYMDNPDRNKGEVSKSALFSEFVAALKEYGVPAWVPVGVIFEPSNLDLSKAVVTEAFAYKGQMDVEIIARKQAQQTTMDASDTTTKLSETQKKIAENFHKDAGERPRSLRERIEEIVTGGGEE